MNLVAFLFDLDGTLVNSLPDITGVINSVRQRYGGEALTESQVLPSVGFGAERLLRECVGGLAGVPELKELVEQYRRGYDTWDPKGDLYPGVAETLGELRTYPNVRLAVVTNKLTSASLVTLEDYLPDIQFDDVSGPDRVSEMKPSPVHALEVLRRLKVPPAQAFFVGDHEVDRDCAQAAGITFFGATYGLCKVKVAPGQELRRFSELMEKIPNIG